MISRFIGKGNKSSGFILSVQSDLISHKISLDNIRGDETLQQVEDILEFVDSFSEDYSKFSSKDLKLLASVTSLLSIEFGRNPTNASSPAVVKACKLKAVVSIFRLLCIPFICKNAMENCVIGLCNCIDPSDAHLSLIALNCICRGLITDNDDAFKCSICLQLERLGFYEKLLGIFDHIVTNNLRKNNGNESLLLHLVLLSADHLVWLLAETTSPSNSSSSTDFKSFQTRIVGHILKHHGAIFELTIHDESSMRFATTILLVQVLHSQERKVCFILQETARNYGLMLWTLKRLAELSLEVVILNFPSSSSPIQTNRRGAPPDDHSFDSRSQSLGSTGWKYHPSPVEGVVFDICEAEMASIETNLDAVRLLLTLLCLGDKINQAVVFRALPESFSIFLSFQASHDIADTVSTDTDTNKHGSIMKVGNSVPRIRRLFQGQPKNNIDAAINEDNESLVSLSASVHSTGNVGSAIVEINNCGVCAAMLISSGGARVRVAFAAKMGAFEKGDVNFLLFVLFSFSV